MTQEEKNKILKDFVTNFIQKERQERCYAQLTNPEKRGKFSDRLNHNWDSILNMKQEIYSKGFATIIMNVSANTLFLETERFGKYGARFIGKVVKR